MVENKYMTSSEHTHTHTYTEVWVNKSFPENIYSQVCSHIDLVSESLLQHDTGNYNLIFNIEYSLPIKFLRFLTPIPTPTLISTQDAMDSNE